MTISTVPFARVLANHRPRTGKPAAQPGIRRDPTSLATAILAIAGAALISASAAADSSLLGASDNACPKCQNGTCYQEVVTYRCKQMPDNKPVKKTVYECREVPYCEHKLPLLGHGECCPECEACPRFKKVLVKKEVVVGETCGTKCVPEKFVERIPVPCCRCGYAPPGAVHPPAVAAELKPAAPNSITSLTLRPTRQPLTRAEQLPEAPLPGPAASYHSTTTLDAQRSLSARRQAATSTPATTPRDDRPASQEATAGASTAAADARKPLAIAILDSIDTAPLDASNPATTDTTTIASTTPAGTMAAGASHEAASRKSASHESESHESESHESESHESATSPARVASDGKGAASANSTTNGWRHGRLPAIVGPPGPAVRRSIRDAASSTHAAPVEGQLIRLTPPVGR